MVHGALSIQIWPARPDVVVVRASGRVDAETAPAFLDQCRSCLALGHVVLNLSRVTFLSSSGVGSLLVLCEAARELGRDLRLASPSNEVTLVLDALHLGPALPVYGSETDALERMAA